MSVDVSGKAAPLADKAIAWTLLGVALDFLGEGGAGTATGKGWLDDVAVYIARTDSTGLGARPIERVLWLVEPVGVEGRVVVSIRLERRPLGNDAVAWACNVGASLDTGQLAARSATVLGSLDDSAIDGASAVSAGLVARALEGSAWNVGILSNNHSLVVGLVVLIGAPLAQDAILRAGLGITNDTLRQGRDWGTTVLGSTRHSAVQVTVSTAAACRASALEVVLILIVTGVVGNVVVRLVGSVCRPLAHQTIDWAELCVARHRLGKGWAGKATIGCGTDDLAVKVTNTSSARLIASAMEEVAGEIVAGWEQVSVVLLVVGVLSPLADIAIAWASLCVAGNLLVETGGWLSTILGSTSDVTVATTKTTTARLGANSIPGIVAISRVTHDGDVLTVVVVNCPLRNDCVNWAVLLIARNGAREHGAGMTTILWLLDDLAELETSSVAAGLAAHTGPEVGRDVKSWCAGVLGGIDIVAVILVPLANNAVLWARKWVAGDGLGQWWASLTSKGGLLSDVTVVGANTAAAGLAAESLECILGVVVGVTGSNSIIARV
jgi:hypothetical protein